MHYRACNLDGKDWPGLVNLRGSGEETVGIESLTRKIQVLYARSGRMELWSERYGLLLPDLR